MSKRKNENEIKTKSKQNQNEIKTSAVTPRLLLHDHTAGARTCFTRMRMDCIVLFFVTGTSTESAAYKLLASVFFWKEMLLWATGQARR